MTTPITYGSAYDGSQVTVNTLTGNPLMIPARILERLNNAFLSDFIFRDAGRNNAGVVTYDESTPLFLTGDPEEVAEFGEIPVAAGQRGVPKVAVGTKKGLGVRVSREMRDENRLDDVNRQIIQLTNTMIRADEKAMRSLIENSTAVQSVTATNTWDNASGAPRKNIADAIEKIASAVNVTGDEDILGFVPDTLIIPAMQTPILMSNTEFMAVYNYGVNAAEDVRFTGQLPGEVMGLRVFQSRFWPSTMAAVLQRGVAGFRSDARPLEVTPLYPEGGGPNGGPTESWRSDSTRKRVMGLDQPLAVCLIKSIDA